MNKKSLFIVLLSLCCGTLCAKQKNEATKDSSAIWGAIAEKAIIDGYYAEAGNYIKKMLTANPKDGDAMTLTSLMALESGKYSTCVLSSNTALQWLNPKKDASTMGLDYLYMHESYKAMGDTASAIQCLDKALKLKTTPRDLSVFHYYRGLCYMETHREKEATQDFQKAVEKEPSASRGYEGLGYLAYDNKDYKKAVEYFSAVIKINQETNEKTKPVILYCTSYSLLKLGNEKGGINGLLAYYYATEKTSVVMSFLHEFYTESFETNLTASVKVAANRMPENPIWPRLLGALEKRNFEYETAAAHFMEAIRKSEEPMADDYVSLAQTFHLLGSEDMAIRLADYAVTLDPSKAKDKAGILVSQGKMDDAISVYNDQMAIDSLNHEPIIGLGLCYYYKRDFAMSEKYFQKIAEMYPDYSDGYSMLFCAQRVQGKKEEALKSIQKAASLDTTGEVIFTAQLFQNDPQAETSFLSFYKKEMEDNHDLGTLYYNAVCFYAQLGNFDKAFDYFEKALESGFYQFTHFGYDNDLTELRKDARYPAMMKKYKKIRQDRLVAFEKDNRSQLDSLSASMKEEPVFSNVEQQASFPGGMEALAQYLKNNISYPQEAYDANLQGRVMVSFVVEKDGSITNVTVAKSVTPLLDAEAVRVVESMPNWEPAIQYGKKCRSLFTLPVIFKYK